METGQKPDLRISGAGSAGGGVFHRVSVSGAGKIHGDVEADEVQISGAGEVNGHLRTDTLEASGAFTLTGNLDAGMCTCSGAGKIGGNVKVGTLRISGAMRVDGNLRGGEVTVSGKCKFGGDVEAEHFRSTGGTEVSGLLNADTVEIALGGNGSAREIGGEQITIISAFYSGCLRTDSVEGDEIYLEQTAAKTVRGRRVVIASGCRIDQVEYSESLQIDPGAQVGQSTYTGNLPAPPPVDTTPAQRPQGWAAGQSFGKFCWWQLGDGGHTPSGKIVNIAVGALIAALVLGVVFFIVLPIVGSVVSFVLGIVAVVLLVVAICIPLVIVGAVVARLFRRSR